MARTPLIRSSVLPYHVTVRSNNRDWFYVPMLTVWQFFEEVLIKTIEDYGIQVHCFVLMSNHIHLGVTTPEQNLDLAMRYLLTEVSRRIQKTSGRINHIFGARYKWTVVTDPIHWLYTYKYILRNPVRAGICPNVEDYPYSTLRKQLIGNCQIPIVEGIDSFWSGIPKNTWERLSWLNRPATPETERILALALRRSTFQLTSQKELRKDVKDLPQLYLPTCG